MTPFLHQVALELMRARSKHDTPINSPHEGYSVILEEVDEFWAMVKMQTKDRDPAEMLTELIHIAAMAERCAEDCGLIDPNYDSATDRVRALFMQKLAKEEPDHPWVKRDEKTIASPAPTCAVCGRAIERAGEAWLHVHRGPGRAGHAARPKEEA